MKVDRVIKPSLEDVRSLLGKEENAGKNMVPMFCEMMADLDTPVSAFLKLREGPQSFLLESVSLGKSVTRYSFIGTKPFKTVESGQGKNAQGDPLQNLQDEMEKVRTVEIPELKLPAFTGGAVGYCSYDAVRHFEPRVAPYLEKQKDILQIPESIYMFFDSLVIFDHVFKTMKVMTHCRADTDDLEAAYVLAAGNINEMMEKLEGSLGDASNFGTPKNAMKVAVDWESASNVGEKGYKHFVTSLKEHVTNGDIIQAVPSQRLTIPMPTGISAFDLYRQMRVVNPSPYMFYLCLREDFQIVGASPEMLVKVNEHREVETHPIAGTRHRGRTQEEDMALEKELLADEKERAEHIMLVDLGRNDIGRVSTPGSVRVSSLMRVEMYSHVMHIVSVVKGQLAAGKTVYDAFRALFPAGTVSGAPKVRAMELISGLEQERRGVYSGSVGYFGFSGVLDTAIAIRTLVVKSGKIYCQAGGGIVYDSDPQAEYQETRNKLKSSLRTIERAMEMKKAPSGSK